MEVPDDILALIDAAGNDRTEFMLNAACEAISRRQSVDVEVTVLLLEDIERDLTITDELTQATNDGFE